MDLTAIGVANAKLSANATKNYPFQEFATFHYNPGDGSSRDLYAPKLKSIINIVMVGANPAHQYFINRIWVNGTNYQFDIYSIIFGNYVCSGVVPSTTFPNSSGYTLVNLTSLNLSGVTGYILILNSNFSTTYDFTGAQTFASTGISPQCVFKSQANFITTTEMIDNSVTLAKIAPEYSIVLPSVIPCVAGHVLDIYHENVLSLDYAKNYAISLYASTTTNFYRNVDKLNWQPHEGDAVATLNYAVSLRSRSNYYYTTTQLVSVSASAGTGLTKKVLIIGDSKTDAGTSLAELMNLFTPDVMKITPLGSRGTTPNFHEGRPGWGISNYCLNQTFNGYTNAFWNPGISSFDFSYYMTLMGYASVDYVFIDLGANDSNLTSTNLIAYYNTVISSIHAYNPNIIICINLQEDHCLAELTDSQIYSFGKVTLAKIVTNLINNFDNITAQKIFVVPNYVNLDLYNDFTISNTSLSSRNPTLVNKFTDPTHPSAYGYYKKSDIYYYYIKYLASLGL